MRRIMIGDGTDVMIDPENLLKNHDATARLGLGGCHISADGHAIFGRECDCFAHGRDLPQLLQLNRLNDARS